MHGHGHTRSNSKTYRCWSAIVARCTNPSDVRYPDYGGRGIKICDEWRYFKNFLRDMGEAPEDKVIDRINNDGDYEKSNCRWASTRESARNTRHSVLDAETVVFIRDCSLNWKGSQRALSRELSKQLGIKSETIREVLKYRHWQIL